MRWNVAKAAKPANVSQRNNKILYLGRFSCRQTAMTLPVAASLWRRTAVNNFRRAFGRQRSACRQTGCPLWRHDAHKTATGYYSLPVRDHVPYASYTVRVRLIFSVQCKLFSNLWPIPCAALSRGQQTRQGLGFSEETHPCASNFIQSIFETVQAECINSVLVQTVYDSIWEKYFLISVLNLGLQIFLLWPRKPLLLPSSVNKTLMSISV